MSKDLVINPILIPCGGLLKVSYIFYELPLRYYKKI